MLVTEFKDRTGLNPTELEYSAIENVYQEHPLQKDEFCAQWKKMPEEMRKAIVEAMLIDMDNKERYHKESEEWKVLDGQREAEVKDAVIVILDDDPDHEAPYKLLKMKDIVLYKARKGHDFNEKDIAWLEQHINEY